MTLRTRLALWYGASLSLVFAALLGGVNYFMHQQAIVRMDAFLEDVAQRAHELIELDEGKQLKLTSAIRLENFSVNEVGEALLQIHLEEGGIVFSSANLENHYLPDLSEVMASGGDVSRLTVGDLRVAEFYWDSLHLIVAINHKPWLGAVSQIHQFSAFGFVIIVAIGVLLGYGISSITLRPLTRIQKAAASINLNTLDQRLDNPAGPLELRELSTLFNQMLERLEQSFKQSQRFTADAAHEIRMPLTVMKLQAEKMAKFLGQDQQELGVMLDEMLDEIARLDEVLEHLLVLARAESGMLPMNVRQVAIEELLGSFADDAQLLCEQAGRTFLMEANPPGLVQVDASWVRQVLFNLLSNALKYGYPDTPITMRSMIDQQHWTLIIQDEGPGVPQNRISIIFERFVRAHPKEVFRSGSGLGLAICKGLINMHGGRMTCRNVSEPKSGFQVQVVIPLIRQGELP